MAHGVGFIGLGNMGQPMALNLAKHGFPLVVHDIDPVAESFVVVEHEPAKRLGPYGGPMEVRR